GLVTSADKNGAGVDHSASARGEPIATGLDQTFLRTDIADDGARQAVAGAIVPDEENELGAGRDFGKKFPSDFGAEAIASEAEGLRSERQFDGTEEDGGGDGADHAERGLADSIRARVLCNAEGAQPQKQGEDPAHKVDANE